MPRKQITKILFLVLIAVVFYSSFIQPWISFAQETPATVQADKTETVIGISCAWYEIFCHLSRFFSWILETIGYLISYIAVLFIALAAGFIQVLIEMSRDLLSNIFIQTGFKIVLNLVNLGFILTIIIIAFSTILRFQTYGAKQLLWKLIIAVILVNFSLTIAGVIIDFTNVISLYFLDGASPGNIEKFGDNLANSLNLEKLGLLNINNQDFTAGLGKGLLIMLMSVASLFSTAIFSVLLAIVFWGTAFMILIRNIYIAILLILMPLVWLFWIFPNLSHLWNKWWSNFIRWTFFLPAAMFFIYLSIFSSQQIGEIVNKSQNLSSVQAASNLTNFNPGGITVLLQIVLQIGILVGGLIAANSLGISGASATLGAAKGVKNWAVGKVGKIAMAPVKPLAQRASDLLNKPTFSWIPGAKGAAAKLAEAGARNKEVEEYQKTNLNSLTPAQREQIYKSGPPMGVVAKSALLSSAAKEGKLKQLLEGENLTPEQKEKRLNQFVTAAERTHRGMEVKDIPEIKDIKNTDIPLFAKITGQSIKDIVEKTTPKDIAKQSSEALANPELLASLNNKQIEQAAKTGVTAILNQLKVGVATLKTQQPNHPNVQLIEEGIAFQGKKPTPEESEKLREQKRLEKIRSQDEFFFKQKTAYEITV